MQFCREMLRLEGREMSMLEVGEWMVLEGISTLDESRILERSQPPSSQKINPDIEIDLRRYFRADHPQMYRRGISPLTCRYLGCGFLPERAKASSPLNGRLVFQIRGLRENGNGIGPVIISHCG